MDYQILKAADAALGIEDPGEAAAALNAQTVTHVRDVPKRDARSLLFDTAEFTNIEDAATSARITVSDPPTPGEQMAAAVRKTAMLAFRVFTTDDVSTLSTTTEAAWGAVSEMLDVLLMGDLISSGTHAALIALRTVTEPAWPALDAGMVQTARAQP